MFFSHTRLGYGLLLFACVLLSSCADKPPPEPTGDAFRGIFILNEGRWQQNDASMDFYDPENGYHAERYLFSRVNGERLGDVAHSATLEGDTMFVVVNNSQLVYKIQLPSLQIIGRTQLPPSASPRRWLRLGPRKAYVNSLLDGKIYLIDPVTMNLMPQTIAVENWMEDMVKHAGRVWVSCGNYDYGNSERNNRLAIIDPETNQLEGYMELPVENPGHLLGLPDGRLLVSLRGNYVESGSALAVIDPTSRAIDTLILFSGNHYGVFQVPDGIWLTSDSAITRLDPQSLSLQYNFLSRERLGARPTDNLYGINYDTRRQQYYICNAGFFATEGSVIVLNERLERVQGLPAGIGPKQVLVWPE